MTSSGDLFVHWYRDIATVRSLYRERKYRSCTALCEKLLPTTSHPVYRTFLCFYQAVCYESLGNAVHGYTCDKIHLLQQAETVLAAALAASSEVDGEVYNENSNPTGQAREESNAMTPTYVKFRVLDEYGFDSPSSYAESSPKVQIGLADGVTDYNTPGRILEYDRISRFNNRFSELPFESPIRKDYQRQADEFHSSSTKDTSDVKIGHRIRLSQSLSLGHQLADHLIPSPLFSRYHLKSASLPLADNLLSPTPQALTLFKPLPSTPYCRPLPVLPLQPHATFTKTGSKIVLRPRRTTALAALIAKYETSEIFSSIPLNSDTRELQVLDKYEDLKGEEERNRGRTKTRRIGFVPDEMHATPLTQRYSRISHIFSCKPTPSPHRESRTAMIVQRNREFEIYSDIPAAARGDFDHQHEERVRSLQDEIDDSMSTERSIRLELSDDTSGKENWMAGQDFEVESVFTPILGSVFDAVPIPTASLPAYDLNGQNRDPIRGTSRQSRQVAPGYSTSVSPGTIYTAPVSRRTSPKPLSTLLKQHLHLLTAQISSLTTSTSTIENKTKIETKPARIARLKAQGWTGVSAKEKGFKGKEYFDRFVSEVLAELEEL